MRPARQVADELRERARRGEPTVTRLLAGLVAEHGGRLAGRRYRLKGSRRLEEKVAERRRRAARMGDPSVFERAGDDIGDVLRYSVLFAGSIYADGYLAVLTGLEAEGVEVVGLRNTWSGGPYRGLNVTFRVEGGLAFEIQFHTADSFRRNQLTREMYEERRSPKTPPVRREQLVDESIRILEDLEVPPGAAELQ